MTTDFKVLFSINPSLSLQDPYDYNSRVRDEFLDTMRSLCSGQPFYTSKVDSAMVVYVPESPANVQPVIPEPVKTVVPITPKVEPIKTVVPITPKVETPIQPSRAEKPPITPIIYSDEKLIKTRMLTSSFRIPIGTATRKKLK